MRCAAPEEELDHAGERRRPCCFPPSTSTAQYPLKVAREPLILLGSGAEVESSASVGQSVLLVFVASFYGWLFMTPRDVAAWVIGSRRASPPSRVVIGKL